MSEAIGYDDRWVLDLVPAELAPLLLRRNRNETLEERDAADLARVLGNQWCDRCENLIDPDCCHCGDDPAGHRYADPPHSFIPSGCECGYHGFVPPAERRRLRHGLRVLAELCRVGALVADTEHRAAMRSLALLCAVAGPPLPGELAWHVVAEVAFRCRVIVGTLSYWHLTDGLNDVAKGRSPICAGIEQSVALRVAVDWYHEHVGAV